METLLIVFIVVTAVAVVIQMGILVALYAAVKKSTTRMEALATEVQTRAIPALDAANTMLTEYRPKVETILNNLSETTTTAKDEMARLGPPAQEMMERVRLQLARVDELLTRVLDRVEHATHTVEQSVSGPVRQASGVLQGLTTGLATLFGRGPYGKVKKPTPPKEDMFI